MSVHDEQVDIVIVVVVEEFHAPSAHQARNSTDVQRSGQVVERLVSTIPVYGIHFVVHVSDKQVLPAILIKVGGIHAHSRAGTPFLTEGNAGFQSNIHECPILLIEKQKILHRVIGNEKVHPAIVVDVSGNDTPCFAERLGNPGFLGNVLERSVSVIMKKPAAHPRVDARYTVGSLVRLKILAVLVL